MLTTVESKAWEYQVTFCNEGCFNVFFIEGKNTLKVNVPDQGLETTLNCIRSNGFISCTNDNFNEFGQPTVSVAYKKQLDDRSFEVTLCYNQECWTSWGKRNVESGESIDQMDLYAAALCPQSCSIPYEGCSTCYDPDMPILESKLVFDPCTKTCYQGIVLKFCPDDCNNLFYVDGSIYITYLDSNYDCLDIGNNPGEGCYCGYIGDGVVEVGILSKAYGNTPFSLDSSCSQKKGMNHTKILLPMSKGNMLTI